MKKTIIALIALAGVASADYVWKGGSTVDSNGWKNSENWTLTEGETFGGLGPGITNSDMWDDIYVSGVTGSVGNESEFTLEGWSFNLHVSNGSDLEFKRIRKFQNGANITIDETSALTIYSYYGGYDSGRINLNNKGSFTLGYSLRTQEGEGFYMNLYDTGIVTLKAQNTGSMNYAKVSAITAMLTGSKAGIQERVLVDLATDQISFDGTETTYTFTDANGVAMTEVDSLEALSTATAPSYFVTKDADGIKVSYVTIPEPTTATLSLLALAGLAARRRRK